MKPTLYEALGLSQTAADWEIKAALRRLVRRYYTKTKAGHTDVEEALRFLNHASHVLGSPARRAEYDAELAKNYNSAASLTTVGGPAYDDASVATTVSSGGASITLLGLPRDATPSAADLGPEWGGRLADIRRTRAGQLASLVIVSFTFLLVWNFALPEGNAAAVLKFALVMLIAVLGAAGVVFAVVRILSRSFWRPPAPEGPITLVEGMIPRWRRDRTVIMGDAAPVEDATWLFRLRMAELKRVSANRVSDPQPVMRLFARLFDYALWAMTVLAALSLLVWLGVVPAVVDEILSHPLLAPIWITASWIPVEALFLNLVQTTPGRWLLCVYLNYEVSNPYSPDDTRFKFGGAFRRAADVWWRGCGGWLPVVALVAMARAREHVNRSGETRWDSERDCLVTHGPVGTVCLITLALGLTACTLVVAARWREPVQTIAQYWQQGWTSATGRFGSAPPPASVSAVDAKQARISRIDEVTPPPEPVVAAAPPPPVVAAPSPMPPPAPAVVPAPAIPLASAPKLAVQPHLPSPVLPQGKPPAPPPAAIAVAPELSPSEQRDRRVAGYMRLAERQQASGDYAGLAKTCQRWADDDWRNPRAYFCAGMGLQGVGQHKQAIAMFNKAGSLLPRDDPMRTQIGEAVLRSFRAQTGS